MGATSVSNATGAVRRSNSNSNREGELLQAHPAVEADPGRVALWRAPLVYFPSLIHHCHLCVLCGLLDSTYSIDSTHFEAIQHNDAASWNYDPTAEGYHYGFGCTLVSTGAKISIAVLC